MPFHNALSTKINNDDTLTQKQKKYTYIQLVKVKTTKINTKIIEGCTEEKLHIMATHYEHFTRSNNKVYKTTVNNSH